MTLVEHSREPSGYCATQAELDGNIALLGRHTEVPHECNDSECPGNLNRLRLAAADEICIAYSVLIVEVTGLLDFVERVRANCGDIAVLEESRKAMDILRADMEIKKELLGSYQALAKTEQDTMR